MSNHLELVVDNSGNTDVAEQAFLKFARLHEKAMHSQLSDDQQAAAKAYHIFYRLYVGGAA